MRKGISHPEEYLAEEMDRDCSIVHGNHIGSSVWSTASKTCSKPSVSIDSNTSSSSTSSRLFSQDAKMESRDRASYLSEPHSTNMPSISRHCNTVEADRFILIGQRRFGGGPVRPPRCGARRAGRGRRSVYGFPGFPAQAVPRPACFACPASPRPDSCLRTRGR